MKRQTHDTLNMREGVGSVKERKGEPCDVNEGGKQVAFEG